MRSRVLRRLAKGLAFLLLALTGTIAFFIFSAWTSYGTAASGARLQRVESSPQYANDRFDNVLPTQQTETLTILRRWLAGAKNTEPNRSPEVDVRSQSDFELPPASGLRITWLGHSSMLVEIDGHRLLTDPVFSERASPWSLYGPRRFFEPPLTATTLPSLDAVVLSHDHFDHLDETTIKALADHVPLFLAPLGLGAHLEYWGVAPDRIVEVDWWESVTVGDLELTGTPARHFSGRSLWDTNRTLWASWAIVGHHHRVYFSGDTAMFPEFTEIGRRFGPFDATMMEVGAYSADWPDVHLGPEQAVQAHEMVGGALLFPIHWGTFNLALHSWIEPVERLRVAARDAGVRLVVPRPGQRIEPADPPPIVQWWDQVPWRTVTESPVVSTGLEIAER